jgi:hypothetical protein
MEHEGAPTATPTGETEMTTAKSDPLCRLRERVRERADLASRDARPGLTSDTPDY